MRNFFAIGSFLSRAHAVYAMLVFALLFLLLFPFFFFFIFLNDKHRILYFLNWLWAKLFFFLIFVPVELTYEEPLSSRKQYIFCANHFSFLDIPTMGYLKQYGVFVGKSSLAKVPVFGFMFKRIHIAVDRSKLRSRHEALKKALEVIGKGRSLFIFPEGGILTKSPPELAPFKDGAFRAAIDKQIPVVPVTIPYNWIILPDDNRFLIHWKKIKIVVHKPISTESLTLEHVSWLKNETFDIIDRELKKHFDHA